MVIDKNSVITIKETELERIGFIPITKEQFQQIDEATEMYYKNQITLIDFKEKYIYHPLAFILYGKANEATSEMLDKYMNKASLKEGEQFVNSYECFCGKRFGLDYTKNVLHRSALDSWKCLLSFTNNPEYACIVNLKYL